MSEPEHSFKGASSAERWMNCGGSSALLSKLEFPPSDEPEWTALGLAAHELIPICLTGQTDTWEHVGSTVRGCVVDKTMADAVQTFLDYVRPFMVPGTTIMVEAMIGKDPAKRPHPQFYGKVDLGAYNATLFRIVDYKHGEGIVVDPEWNKQMLYYAYGILYERRQRGVLVNPDRPVILTIVQPRAYHEEGPIREWETTAGEVLKWGDEVLIPKMEAAELDNDFNPGSWCRFCPAKLFCPILSGLFGCAAKANPDAIHNLSDLRLSLEYKQREAVKFYMAALDAEVFRRNNTGNIVPGTKLVWKKSNRVFKDGAEAALVANLGLQVYTKPSLCSPAVIEKFNDVAAGLVKEWSYMPKTGLTVAPDTDKRSAVAVEKITDVFAHYKQETTSDD